MTLEEFKNAIINITGFAFPCKGKVIKSYIENNSFYVDCKKINLDDSESDIVIPKIKVPKIWGKLQNGDVVNINFYEGNINYPFVSNVEGIDMPSPIGLWDLIKKILEVLISLKTVGSPANHTVSPDDITKLTEIKNIDLEKLSK
ncbi:MAG: hypothetical protein QXL18_04430 [Candidatus Woesearchaeota archaeon]